MTDEILTSRAGSPKHHAKTTGRPRGKLCKICRTSCRVSFADPREAHAELDDVVSMN